MLRRDFTKPIPQQLDLWSLPALCTAEQIAQALQCSARTVLNLSKGASPKIPMAFQAGRIIRFDPRQVAKALGLTPPESSGRPTDSADFP